MYEQREMDEGRKVICDYLVVWWGKELGNWGLNHCIFSITNMHFVL